ncbi:Signal transduction histidine-protein kinase BarA [compost metagenome]
MPDVTLLTAAVSALGLVGHYTWMDLVARGLLAIAHLAGLAACAHLIRHRLAIPFSPLFAWFGLFILADSTGLLIDLFAALQPIAPLRSAWNVVVAVMSVCMTGALAVLLPRALNDGALQAYLHRERLRQLEEEVAARTAELAREKAFVERLVQHVPAGIVFLDRDLVVRRANPAYLKLIGREPAQLLHQPFFQSIPDTEPVLAPVLQRVMASGQPFEAQAFRHGGTAHQPRYWDFAYVPIAEDGQAVEGVLICASEATARVEKERLQADQIAQLQAIDRYKDELLAIFSHELRTPLNFIIGFASLLEEEFVDPLSPAQRTYVSRIMLGADRMLGLVDSLLDLARLRSGRLHLSPAELDLQPILEDVITGMRPLAAERGLQLEADLAVPHQVVGDRRWIAQALAHMLGNAIKFTPSGRIDVRAYVEGDRAIVEVSDTGPGIASEDLPRVFERFRQLDMGATRAAGGTGLGLAIVKEVVEAHAGEVGVRSDLGAGTTFWFSLAVGVSCRVPAGHTDDVTAV